MNPLDKAKALLAELVTKADVAGLGLPSIRYYQIGDAVVTCGSVIVTLTRMDPAGPEYQVASGCMSSQVGSFVITIARDCGVIFDEDGVDVPALVINASEDMSADGDFLWGFAAGLPTYIARDYSVTWVLTGALLITSLTLTVGID